MKPYVTMEEVIRTQERTAEHTDFLQQRMAVLMGVLQEQQYMLLMNFQINQACIMTRKAFMC